MKRIAGRPSQSRPDPRWMIKPPPGISASQPRKLWLTAVHEVVETDLHGLKFRSLRPTRLLPPN